MVEPLKRRFLDPRFLIPVAILLWLLVAAPLALLGGAARAAPLSNCPANLNSSNWSWGIYSPSRLTLINACWHVGGALVDGEGWYDGDFDWYVKLDDQNDVQPWNYNGHLYTYSDFAAALRSYDECTGIDSSGTTLKCDFLAETIPVDRPSEPPYCLDQNYTGTQFSTHGACRGQGYHVDYTGALVVDTGHPSVGYWEEIHPNVHQVFKDSSGNILADNTSTASRPGGSGAQSPLPGGHHKHRHHRHHHHH